MRLPLRPDRELVEMKPQWDGTDAVVAAAAACCDDGAPMPRVDSCHKCARTDVEGALTADLNLAHWQQCVDATTGAVVDGTLLECPGRRHWVCARCIVGNWWGVRGRRGALCDCAEAWPLQTLAIAGCSRRCLQRAHMQRLAPGAPCVAPPEELSSDEETCPDTGLVLRDDWWCAVCKPLLRHAPFWHKPKCWRQRKCWQALPAPPARRVPTLFDACRLQLTTQEEGAVRCLATRVK